MMKTKTKLKRKNNRKTKTKTKKNQNENHTARWPNQQSQSTEGNQLVVEIRLESHQNHSTMLQ